LRRRVDSIRDIRHKGVIDIVTDVDLESEKEVCDTILSAFPTHSILGEEGGANWHRVGEGYVGRKPL